MNLRTVVSAMICSVLVSSALSAQSTYIVFKYAQLDYPGASSSTAMAINNSNVVVGWYTDSAGVYHGFKYSNGTYTAINVPNAYETQALGINDLGDIVGAYVQGSQPNVTSHGFLLHNGAFTTIDYPGAQTGTVATGINKSGTIVGYFDGGTGGGQGFIYQNGAYRVVNPPQPAGQTFIDTQLYSINNLGQVAGVTEWVDAFRGFWGPSSGTDFDFLQAQFVPDNQVNAINGRGDIVGCQGLNSVIGFNVESESSESSEAYPALEILPNPIDPSQSCVNGINYARVIVGIAGPGGAGAGHGFIAIPALTLNVTSPKNKTTVGDPVHVAATASGINSVSQIQVWVNSKEVYHVSGGSLNAYINLPLGSNERFVVQAIDSKGLVAKVVESITVN